MMRHLFLEKDLLPVRDWPGQLRNDLPPISFPRRDHFLRGGMLFASRLQIERVKGLVDDNRVPAVPPGAHHCGRDISRARPHRDAHDFAPNHSKLYRARNGIGIEIPRASIIGEGMRAAERRSPKSGGNFRAQFALAFWSAALLRRF